MSQREAVLAALYATISPIAMIPATSLPVKVLRNQALPVAIPRGGVAILFDGDPGEPEYTLSPMTWHYEHRAEMIVAVQTADGGDAVFDLLCAALGAAMVADTTLGGTCDWVEPQAPMPDELPFEGAETIKAARIAVILHYATTAPLG
ncbi:MAG: acyl-CoA transferase [Tabrizicola sp.]|nr:acyl-CoA transferase [Tabrizicola sp.]